MSNKAPRLRELQSWFYNFVVAPYGVKDAKEQMSEDFPESVPLEQWIVAEKEDQAIGRLDIYANMYFYRLVGIFQDQFDVLATVLGEETFEVMCVDYLKAYPPTTYSLDFAKKMLPEFIRQHTPPDQPPWLYDLAVLEDTRVSMITYPDSDVLKVEDLQRIPHVQWGSIRFAPRPAFTMLELEYPVFRVWRAVNDEKEIPTIEKEPYSVLVWRNNLTVYHEVITPEEANAVKMLQENKTFEEICWSFVENPYEDNLDEAALQEPIQKAYQTLSRWVERGMLLPLQ